jgi:hypothetical protein
METLSPEFLCPQGERMGNPEVLLYIIMPDFSSVDAEIMANSLKTQPWRQMPL